MQIKEILMGIPLLMFVFWVFIAPVPQDRIDRVCSPIQWVGNLTTSLTALSTEKHTETAVTWADKLDYSCQFLIWRLIYQDDYNQAIKDGLIQPNGAPAAPRNPSQPVDAVPIEAVPLEPAIEPVQEQAYPEPASDSPASSVTRPEISL